MALTFTSQKCDCCGGALEYDKAHRVYTCLYCGNEIVRQESYDGQFSIKYVARQALICVANRDFDGAQEQLVECSKIDPRYVGTTIANLAYNVVALSMAGDAEKKRRLTAQISDYHSRLKQVPLTPGSDEEDFYESLDSADVYGMLALLFDAVGDEERERFVAECVDPTSVRSASAAKDVVGYALSEGKYALVDQLVQSPAELDCDFVFSELLRRYPDSENKTTNVEQVAARIGSKDAARKHLDDYLGSSGDTLTTKLAIAKSCFGMGMRGSTPVLLSALLPSCQEADQAKTVFEMACGVKLTDEETAGVVDYCVRHASAEFGALGLDVLKSSGQFVSISQANALSVLFRSDLGLEEKLSLLNAVYSFNLQDRFKQSVISAYLREGAPHPDRAALVRRLVEAVSDVNPAAVEDYLTHFAADGADKKAIVEALLSKNPSGTALKRALSNYLASSPDNPEVTQGVLDVFVGRGLVTAEVDVVSRLCCTPDPAEGLVTIKAMKASGWSPGKRDLNTYLVACSKGTAGYTSELASELLANDSAISPEALSMYVLYCQEPSGNKAQWVTALVPRTSGAPSSIRCRVTHLGKTVDCTLLQGYLLASPDIDATARAIIANLDGNPSTVQSQVMVTDSSGTRAVKFKKYVNSNKSSLSAAAQEYCEAQKLFGGIF